MKPKIKKLWVKALRSDEYNQGTGRLVSSKPDGDYFCCLGVLVDLYIEHHVCEGWSVSRYPPTLGVSGVFENAEFTLPNKVMKWAGLESGDPMVNAKHFKRTSIPYTARVQHSKVTLSYLNDRKTPFEQIAELIEEQL